MTSFAMAFFSLTLTLSLAGVRIKDLANLDLRPSSVKKAVALGSVRADHAVPGTALRLEWTVEARRRSVPASVVPLLFFDPPRKRA